MVEHYLDTVGVSSSTLLVPTKYLENGTIDLALIVPFPHQRMFQFLIVRPLTRIQGKTRISRILGFRAVRRKCKMAEVVVIRCTERLIFENMSSDLAPGI